MALVNWQQKGGRPTRSPRVGPHRPVLSEHDRVGLPETGSARTRKAKAGRNPRLERRHRTACGLGPPRRSPMGDAESRRPFQSN